MISDKEIKLVLSAPLTHDPEAMIPPNWFKQLANIHLKLADYGGQDHFENFKLSRQLMEKFVRYRYQNMFLYKGGLENFTDCK